MCLLSPCLLYSYKKQATEHHFTVDHSEMAVIKEYAISLIAVSFL